MIKVKSEKIDNFFLKPKDRYLFRGKVKIIKNTMRFFLSICLSSSLGLGLVI